METVSNENSLSKDAENEDNDLELKLKQLADRLELHEAEKQKMREEFGQQRAKMKEMFLQKEEELKRGSSEHSRLLDEIKRLQTELNDARTQVTVVNLELSSRLEEERRRYQDEVASLQQLVTETVEESSRNDEEVQRLRRLNEKLEAELEDVRHSNTSSSEGAGPQLLAAPGAMISTLARKVVSQLGADSSSLSPSSLLSQSQPPPASLNDNLEESMRKAQEDAEVLRSLVIPLEEEIKALKDKLRRNDKLLCNIERGMDKPIAMTGSSGLTNDLLEINVAANDGLEFNSGRGDEGDLSTKALKQETPVDVHQAVLLSSSSQAATTTETMALAPQSTLPSSASASSLLLIDINNDDPLSVPPATADVCNDESKRTCDMCTNYEAQLVVAQEKCKELERQVATLERCKEELAKEALIRKDMEQKWNEKKETHKAEVSELQAKTKETEKALKEVQELFKNAKAQITEQLSRLSSERKTVQIQLDRLQLENENLVGKRNATAHALQDEIINLPDNVEELQELLLRCREDLISARVGQEAAEQEVENLKEEAQIQMFQTQAENQSSQHLNNSLTVEVETLKSQLHKSESARHQSQLAWQRLNNEEKNLRLEIEDINMQLISATNAKKQLEEQVSELRSSLSSLQTELHNSEIVQKDFVRLSQSLQQELERIRSSHTQVRWEHEEDVEQCPGCRQLFTVTRRKQHCRHCGRVFCTSCLVRTVSSGPNQRPSKVCDVCHTLLVQDTAPYFSTEPPHSTN